MSRRRCPRCQQAYAAPARFCVRDGTPLVEVAEAPAASEGLAAEPPRPASPSAADLPAAKRSDPIPPPSSKEARREALATLTQAVLESRYRVHRRLGEGGMAYVYLAEELDTGREVAVKVLTPKLSRDPGSVERLRREAQIAQRFTHPNVCPIYRLGEGDGLIYIVMPYLPGEPLHEAEGRKGPYPVAEGVAILVQIAQGLQHAHDLGVVHRDLKPENVMLVPDTAQPHGTRAVVMDFGLAKQRQPGDQVAKLTQTGIVLGTPEFMSPEQIRGRLLDGRSDMYALAVLAFELFTGELPFSGKTAQETMLARLRGEPRELRALRPDFPPRLEAVLRKAMALDPADRFGTMEEFADALAGAQPHGLLSRLLGR